MGNRLRPPKIEKAHPALVLLKASSKVKDSLILGTYVPAFRFFPAISKTAPASVV